jgi:hypothetical protein
VLVSGSLIFYVLQRFTFVTGQIKTDHSKLGEPR